MSSASSACAGGRGRRQQPLRLRAPRSGWSRARAGTSAAPGAPPAPRRQRRARLVQVGDREVVVQRAAPCRRSVVRAALDGDAGVGVAAGSAARPPRRRRSGRRCPARRPRSPRRRRSRPTTRSRSCCAGVTVVDVPPSARVAELLVQHVEREPDRAQRVAAPVLLRVLLRVRVLERDSGSGTPR